MRGVHRLKSALLHDEKEDMKTDMDLASLGNNELVTLVFGVWLVLAFIVVSHLAAR